MISKILENQGEIIHQIRKLSSKVDRVENRLKDLEESLVENFDATNEKAFQEVIFSQICKFLQSFALFIFLNI